MNQDEEAQADLKDKIGADAYDRYTQGQMNKEDQEEFDKLCKLQPHELQWHQKVFLAARRDYLNKELTERFQPAIDEVLDFNKTKDGVNEDTGLDNSDKTPSGDGTPAPTRKELTQTALDLGISQEEIDAAKKNADLAQLIADKESATE